MQQKNSRVLKWSLVAGIVLVLNLFVGYSLSVIYKSPVYENYCKNTQVVQSYTTKTSCLAVGGQWNESATPVSTTSGQTVKFTSPEQLSYCNETYTCSNNYYDAQKSYDRNVFVTLVVIGVLMLLLGFFLRRNDVLSYGFSLGGVLSFIIASVRYWSAADGLIKVIILALALAALLYLAYKKFSPTNPYDRNETLRS